MNRINISRRQALAGIVGVGALGALAACGASPQTQSTSQNATASRAPRPSTGRIRTVSLTARPVQVDLGGRIASTWAYDDQIPGKPITATAGDRIKVTLNNQLPESTSVHWHGLAIPNAMDGVPNVTTPPTEPGTSFEYDFIVPDPGTHWFHPHTGLQLDRGLYAPFIVSDPNEPGQYDHEWVIVLDDWTDGIGDSPDQILANLTQYGGDSQSSMGMAGHGGGDINYPLHLINGRANTDPDVLKAKPGQRVRLRIINAAADTIYQVNVPDHPMTITHTDGYPVKDATTKSLIIGMGERYDAKLTLSNGAFPLIARPLGKQGVAHALIRTSKSAQARQPTDTEELDPDALTVESLQATDTAKLPATEPQYHGNVTLQQLRAPYKWAINGQPYETTVPLEVDRGQSGRLKMFNHSMMPHPVHLHGHTFQVGPAGGTGPRKDTLLLASHATVDVDFIADNPGKWMLHCHNGYHAEAGMMTRLEYTDQE